MSMKVKQIFFIPIILALIEPSYCRTQAGLTTGQELKLWYDKPATIWEEALPLGNGKTGAMVFGGIATERYQLNDLTLWSGAPKDGNNPAGPEILEETRKAVNAGDYAKAAEAWKKIHGPYSARYLPMADLAIKMLFTDSTVSDYHRELDIQNAISTVRYKCNGVGFSRETFISYPDKTMAIRIMADKKQTISLETWLTSKLHYRIIGKAKDYIVLRGKAPKYVANRNYENEQIVYDPESGEGTNFEVHLKIKAFDGKVKITGTRLVIEKASKVVIYLAGATSYNGFDKSPGLEGKEPSIEAANIIANASAKSFEQLKEAHIADYSMLFGRVSFNLGYNPDALKLPTDERMILLNHGGNDNQLVALYYQFGRYLLISSSRDQSLPANLQGIWNDHVQPPWGSNYTTNINTEMNYWLAENTNLSE